MKKRYKSKTRRDVKGSDLRGEELSGNEQLLEDLTGRFDENERRTEADAQKRQSYIKNEKKESSTNEKKRKRKIWRETKTCKEQDESGTRDKNKVEGVAHK